MKKAIRLASLTVGAVAMSLAMSATAADEAAPAAASTVNLDSDMAKESYAIGANVGKSIGSSGLDIEIEAFLAGFHAARENKELAMTDEEIGTTMMALQGKMQAAAQQKAMEEGAAAKGEGDAYLAENAKKEGVKVTESGLQYKVVQEGDGAVPTAADTVKVHYTGTFINGEQFDSSRDGDPATFGVTQVIKGWTEALQLMKVGSKYELAIPADLAYGPGRPGIPPNSVLLFEVELLDIVKQ